MLDMSWLWRWTPEIFAISLMSGVVVSVLITVLFVKDMLRMLWKS